MREVVIVISDLYVSPEAPDRQLPGVAVPGLEYVARLGKRSAVVSGWRAWLANRLGREREIASAAPATVAAFALAPPAAPAAVIATGSAPAATTPRIAPTVAGVPTSAPATVWMATPVHLVAGLTNVHFDRRSVLHLPPEDLAAVESDFRRTFADTGFALRPLASGDFLLSGPEMPLAATLEPARSMGESIAHDSRGAGAPALRRLGTEIEMWLHDHPLNDTRARRGELPITGLWLWGAGPMRAVQSGQAHAPAAPTPAGTAPTPAGTAPATLAPGGAPRYSNAPSGPDILFGTDAYLSGLGVLMNVNVLPIPPLLTDVFSYPHAQRAVLVIEIAPMLHSNPQWTFSDALMQIDRYFIAPAAKALSDRRFNELVLVANDRELILHARDRLKVWRRTQRGLTGLQ